MSINNEKINSKLIQFKNQLKTKNEIARSDESYNKTIDDNVNQNISNSINNFSNSIKEENSSGVENSKYKHKKTMSKIRIKMFQDIQNISFLKLISIIQTCLKNRYKINLDEVILIISHLFQNKPEMFESCNNFKYLIKIPDMFLKFASIVKLNYYEKNTLIMNSEKQIYEKFIIKGEVEKLQLVKKQVNILVSDYIRYLNTLKNNNEDEIFKICVKINSNYDLVNKIIDLEFDKSKKVNKTTKNQSNSPKDKNENKFNKSKTLMTFNDYISYIENFQKPIPFYITHTSQVQIKEVKSNAMSINSSTKNFKNNEYLLSEDKLDLDNNKLSSNLDINAAFNIFSSNNKSKYASKNNSSLIENRKDDSGFYFNHEGYNTKLDSQTLIPNISKSNLLLKSTKNEKHNLIQKKNEMIPKLSNNIVGKRERVKGDSLAKKILSKKFKIDINEINKGSLDKNNSKNNVDTNKSSSFLNENYDKDILSKKLTFTIFTYENSDIYNEFQHINKENIINNNENMQSKSTKNNYNSILTPKPQSTVSNKKQLDKITLIALEDTYCLSFVSKEYEAIIKEAQNKIFKQDLLLFLRKCYIFNKLDDRLLSEIILKYFKEKIFYLGEELFKEGENINEIFFIRSGYVNISTKMSILEFKKFYCEATGEQLSNDDLNNYNNTKQSLANTQKIFSIINCGENCILGLKNLSSKAKTYLYTAEVTSKVLEVLTISYSDLLRISKAIFEVKNSIIDLENQLCTSWTKRLVNLYETTFNIHNNLYDKSEIRNKKSCNYNDKENKMQSVDTINHIDVGKQSIVKKILNKKVNKIVDLKDNILNLNKINLNTNTEKNENVSVTKTLKNIINYEEFLEDKKNYKKFQNINDNNNDNSNLNVNSITIVKVNDDKIIKLNLITNEQENHSFLLNNANKKVDNIINNSELNTKLILDDQINLKKEMKIKNKIKKESKELNFDSNIIQNELIKNEILKKNAFTESNVNSNLNENMNEDQLLKNYSEKMKEFELMKSLNLPKSNNSNIKMRNKSNALFLLKNSSNFNSNILTDPILSRSINKIINENKKKKCYAIQQDLNSLKRKRYYEYETLSTDYDYGKKHISNFNEKGKLLTGNKLKQIDGIMNSKFITNSKSASISREKNKKNDDLTNEEGYNNVNSKNLNKFNIQSLQLPKIEVLSNVNIFKNDLIQTIEIKSKNRSLKVNRIRPIFNKENNEKQYKRNVILNPNFGIKNTII